MGLKYLYDTNIFVDYLAGRLKNKELFTEEFLFENEIIISSINRIEFLSNPIISDEEEQFLKNVIEQFEVTPINREIEDEAIKIRQKYKLKLPDAITASTAKVTQAILVTNDKKDFNKVDELMLYEK